MVEDAEERPGEQTGLREIAGIARHLAEADTLDETLQRIVDQAAEYVDGCDGATLMFLQEGRVVTPASTGHDAYEADQAQHRTQEGPCLTAMREHETVVIADIASEERWSAWRDEISEFGWRSMVGLRLFVAQNTLGALNLYSRSAHSFDEHAQALGQVFASHAAVAMKAAISETGLKLALENRDVIGQAKGVLMERQRLSGREAFARLKEISSRSHVKVRDLARDIVETGEVPDVE